MKTNLKINGAPLPPNFSGTPQAFFEAMLARMAITSPDGFNSFVIGPNEPTSNSGPWLKDGLKWYVWSDSDARYIPVNTSDSVLEPYVVSQTQPADGRIPLWFQLSSELTSITGVWFFINNGWQAIVGTSGTTSQRPAQPADLQKYYDTDIQCEIWFERGKWRTVSGSKGDTKFVTWPTGSEALRRSPGWEILGTGETANNSWVGAVLAGATKDSGGTDTDLATNMPLVNPHDALTTAGEETHELLEKELPSHKHAAPVTPNNAVQVIGNTGSTDATAYGLRFGGSATKPIPVTGVPWTAPVGGDPDNQNITVAHNNLQPTLYLFCLRKA